MFDIIAPALCGADNFIGAFIEIDHIHLKILTAEIHEHLIPLMLIHLIDVPQGVHFTALKHKDDNTKYHQHHTHDLKIPIDTQ